jgi:hypothetical protein
LKSIRSITFLTQKKKHLKKKRKLLSEILKKKKSNNMNTMTIVLYLQTVLASFNLYAAFGILVPGLALNCLTVAVFMRRKFWSHTTMGFYYGTSVAMSALVNLVGLLAFLPVAFKNDLSLKSDVLCQLLWLARFQVIGGVAYHRMLITTDLMLNTVYPRRFLFLKKWKNVAVLAVSVQLIVAVCDTTQWWRFVKSTPGPNTSNQTTTSLSLSCTLPQAQSVVSSFTSILNRVLPSVYNASMSVLIIQKLVKSRQNVDRTKKLPGRLINFAVSLVAQNVIFFVMTLPHVIVSTLQLVNTLTGQTGDLANFVNVVASFSVWGAYSYEALPFFMNLAFNKIFRGEILSILCGFDSGVADASRASVSRTRLRLSMPTIVKMALS